MTKNTDTTESEQTTDSQLPACICGMPIREFHANLLYNNESGYMTAGPLCATCQQDIEFLLEAGLREHCDHCQNTLSGNRHGIVRELNEEGHLEEIGTLCRPCLKDRYS